MTPGEADGTAYVQGFLDRAEPVPPGTYQIATQLRVPGDYIAKARAAGRTETPDGGFFLSDPSDPARLEHRDGAVIVLSGEIAPGKDYDPATPAEQTAAWLFQDGAALTLPGGRS
jgi:hypothetical protein